MSPLKMFKRCLDALVHPEIRLHASTEFPLTGKTLGKAYVVGFVLFIIGSVAPMLLFVGGMTLLAKYADPQFATRVIDLLFANDGMPTPLCLGTLMMSSFLGGFALEMQYLRRLMHRKGYRLRDVIGLSPGPLRGRTKLHTFWNISWRAILAFAIALVVEQALSLVLHAPDQPTIDLARKLTGSSGWMFFVMAAIFAPLLEEFAFRGILFQALRATFHGYRASAAGESARVPGWFGRRIGALLKTAGRADFAAVLFSGFIFAVWHLQFHPVHLLLLTGMGCLLAEVFRRSGTLWTSIAVHALNNGLMALMIMYGAS
jgi:membrane protease YdiL (CAAX protease family)